MCFGTQQTHSGSLCDLHRHLHFTVIAFTVHWADLNSSWIVLWQRWHAVTVPRLKSLFSAIHSACRRLSIETAWLCDWFYTLLSNGCKLKHPNLIIRWGYLDTFGQIVKIENMTILSSICGQIERAKGEWLREHVCSVPCSSCIVKKPPQDVEAFLFFLSFFSGQLFISESSSVTHMWVIITC